MSRVHICGEEDFECLRKQERKRPREKVSLPFNTSTSSLKPCNTTFNTPFVLGFFLLLSLLLY